MTDLRRALQDYLTVRRQLGFELRNDGRLLEKLIGFLQDAGASNITNELAVAWASLPTDARPHRWCQRLGIARGFARYLNTIDPANEVPPVDLLVARRARVAPYIYSQQEITALMAAAGGLTPQLHGATLATLIGLLASCGLRAGEALALDRADIDLHCGALHVRTAKQSKQREVPLHDSTTRALGEYGRLRDRHRSAPQTPAFFVSISGARLSRGSFNCTFRKLICQTGLEGRGERARPRPHDLRHTFAVRTLLEWYRADADVNAQLPLLSTMLGHADPSSTYWYLEAVPELLAVACERLEYTGRERS